MLDWNSIAYYEPIPTLYYILSQFNVVRVDPSLFTILQPANSPIKRTSCLTLPHRQNYSNLSIQVRHQSARLPPLGLPLMVLGLPKPSRGELRKRVSVVELAKSDVTLSSMALLVLTADLMKSNAWYPRARGRSKQIFTCQSVAAARARPRS